MKSTRTGSSYKEEILRFIHAKPNGTFADDRIGVTSAVAEVFVSRGLPVTVSTVSSAISNLAKDGRVSVTYGHRSLDNKLLITAVLVHSEPRHGVAIGPSEPLEVRGPMPHETSNDPIFVMLRSLVRLMENQPSLNEEDIERFQLHVDHLVTENETWEALAQETEDGFAETIDDLRRQLAEAEERHQIELTESNTDVTNELHKSEGRAASLRERAERYRLAMETARTETQRLSLELDTLTSTNLRVATDHEHEVRDIRERLDRSQERVGLLQKTEVEQRESINRLSRLRSSTASVAVRREEYLITQEIFPMAQFIAGIFITLRTLTEHDRPIRIDNDVMVVAGLNHPDGSPTGRENFGPKTFKLLLDLISLKHGSLIVAHTKSPRMKGNVLRDRTRHMASVLDEKVGPLPTSP